MTNESIDAALSANETFSIDLLNKASGATYRQASVYATNSLGQILDEYAVDIGINPNSSKLIFENKRTNQSTSDKGETVAGLNLQEADILAISDDGGVA